MRKILTLGSLIFILNGCIMSGPMALLSPSAKYLLWQADKNDDKPPQEAISVQDLLAAARGFEQDTDNLAPLKVTYDDYVLSDQQLGKLSTFKTRAFDMVCGPYEYGDPLNAASMALRTCGAIKKQFIKQGLKLNVRFNPDGVKGQAVITPIMAPEAQDA